MKQTIQNILHDIIQQHYNISLENIILDTPPQKNMGDIAFGCFVLAKELKKSPMMIAEEMVEFCSNIPEISSASAAGPYLNIFLSDIVFLHTLQRISTSKDVIPKNKTIIVDYIGANVGKPLHIGHMCTPNQGQVLINVYEKLGYNVISDSHIGDWGIIFGKLITAYKKWGDADKLSQNAVDHLFELYVQVSDAVKNDASLEDEFRKEFKYLASGDNDSIELWSEFTRHSIDAMNAQLNRLNVQPDYDIGESFYEGIGLPKMGDYPDLEHSMSTIVDELVKKDIATKNDDSSVGVVFDEALKIPSCILQKRDGGHGYLASDLATIKYRCDNWNPEKIVYFVDVRQQLHLRQTFHIAHQAGWCDNVELIHAHNGFISLKDGAMSTRSGRIIRLEALLDEAESRARDLILTKKTDFSEDELKELSRMIGIGAIKYGYLKKSRETDIVFDWDEFMTFEGNSGPYIQYGAVRAKNILVKADFKNSETSISELSGISFETSEKELIKLLANYTDILEEVADKNMPHILCAYLYDITKAFSSFYTQVNILGETDENLKQSRLQITQAFYTTLSEGLKLLAIEVPEKM